MPVDPWPLTNQDGAVTKLDIRGAGKDASPALLGCFSHNNPSSAVLLATGSPASPGFTETLFEDGAGSLLPRASVGEGTSTKQEDEERVGEKDGPAHVVGPGELGLRGLEKDAGVKEERQQEEERLVKRLKAEKGKGEAGMTIAERLKALSEAIDQEAEGVDVERRRSGGFEDGSGVLVPVGKGGDGALQPQVESLSTVLTQALQSGDESLLEQCLAVGDQGVIKATAERLPSSKVLQFLLR